MGSSTAHRFLALVFLFCTSAIGSTQPDDQEWIWIVGQLEDEGQQEEYAAFTQRMFAYYQDRGSFAGKLVAEKNVDERPLDHVVFMGPLQAFEHREWLAPLVDVAGGRVVVGDQVLREEHCGVFVRNRLSDTVVFTGTSLAGWKDIFAVPTGSLPCSVTVNGAIRFEGRYSGADLKLSLRSFLQPFPDRTQLEALGDSAEAVACEAVFAEAEDGGLSPSFQARLRALVDGQRVLFVGESHWNTGVNQLFNESLRMILGMGEVRAVVLELNYSFSAHFDHFVTLDDAQSQEFFAEVLHPLVGSESVLETLEIVRAHNSSSGKPPVRIACLDMEFGLEATLRHVLLPYLRALDTSFEIDRNALLYAATRDAELARMGAVLEGASDKKVGHPFLTREFLLGVLVNVGDTLARKNQTADRQAALVRNVTDFHGALLEGAGLTIFKGGGFHAQKSARDEGWWREAAYLHQVHPATKGRVATLMIHGLGYGFDDVSELDPKTRMGSATNYHRFVDGYRAGLASGTAEMGQFYLLNDGALHPVESLVALWGESQEENVVSLERIDNRILGAAFGADAGGYMGQNYDHCVFVLRSQIEPTRPLQLKR